MKNFFILILFLFLSSLGFTQTIDGQFEVINNDGSTYSIKILIKLESGGPQILDNATIRFTFNNTSTGLTFPSPPVEGIDYTFNNFQHGGTNNNDYSSSVSHSSTINPSQVSIAIHRNEGGTSVSSTFIEVVTINFGISNPSGNSNLVWTTREFYSPSGTTQWDLSAWPNENTSPLPVELSSFTAIRNQNNVNLYWKTATEVNNNGFEIQREARGQNPEVGNQWEKVGFVQGHGNSNSPKEYSFEDKNLTGGTKFVYRLKQIDNDGQYEYSKEIEVEVVPQSYTLYQNYPNPFNPSTTIRFDLPKAAEVNLTVYNILGEKVMTLANGFLEAGYHSVVFNANNLASGTYIYRLQTSNFIQTKKMLLLK